MKKLFFAALMAVTVASSAFAAGANKVNANAAYTFKSQFKGAANVSWTATDNFVKASFTIDNQKMEAFYNQEGEMIATSKSIRLDELPVTAKRSFAKKFEGYTVKEAIQLEGADETAYYISAENDTEKVILKVGDNNNLVTFKKEKK